MGIERVSVEGGYTYLVEDQDAFVVGTSIGVDVLAWSGHRVALYGQGSGSERLASASFGLSYRYWSP